MRLLHSRDHYFKEFFSSQVPRYAIVSHRWGEEELSYQDFLDGIRTGYGWAKIRQACCIDKKSSAELTEAINSMYQWYAQSIDCYVFLHDIDATYTPPDLWRDSDNDSTFESRIFWDQLGDSSWFKRGWTLQELLAPRSVAFYDKHFRRIADRRALASGIRRITGIPVEYLRMERPVKSASVAERMSWASHRGTTREEDIAYSLLGIFDISMPLLYGEGRKAFLRLQVEIIRKSHDQSIFAWWYPEKDWNGLLARTPRAFLGASKVQQYSFSLHRHYDMTNRGIRMSIRISKELARLAKQSDRTNDGGNFRLLLPLDCYVESADFGTRQLAIKVMAKSSSASPDMLLIAHRVLGASSEAGLVNLQIEGTGSHAYGVRVKYDQATVDHDFTPDVDNDQVFIVGYVPVIDNDEWQVYFPQDGL